jgi:hypothetical protein
MIRNNDMASMGQLTLELEASMVRFQSDMAKPAQITEQAMRKMQASMDWVARP